MRVIFSSSMCFHFRKNDEHAVSLPQGALAHYLLFCHSDRLHSSLLCIVDDIDLLYLTI